MIQAGEICMAEVPDLGVRPVIVVSRESLNRGYYAVVVPCTSSRFDSRKSLPNCVPFYTGDFGLFTNCVAQCENISAIEHNQLNTEAGPIGKLDEDTMQKVVRAIGYVMEADCEPV